MKKADWTDRMLAVLVELYPVETTAYTAAVLYIFRSIPVHFPAAY